MSMLVLMVLLAANDPVTTPVTTAEVNKLDKIECRRLEVTGSRVAGKRVCMTRREWNRAGSETRTEIQNAIARIPAKGER